MSLRIRLIILFTVLAAIFAGTTPAFAACTATGDAAGTDGERYWDAAASNFKVCVGTTWVAYTLADIGAPACTTEAEIEYDSTNHYYKVCVSGAGSAPTRVSRASKTNTGTANLTTTAFTPSNSSLLVAVVGGVTEDGAPSVTVSGGGLTWTKRAGISNSSSQYPTWYSFSEIWTAPVSTGASMTVTLAIGGKTANGKALNVYEYTGYNSSSPVGGTITGLRDNASGAWTINLSATPASSSEIIATAAVDNWDGTGANNITEGTGWTETFMNGSVGAETQVNVQVLGSPSSTNVLWNQVDANNAAGANATGAAIEIKAQPTGGSLVWKKIDAVAGGGGGGGDYLSNLLMHFKLDETTGSTITDSAGGYNLSWTDGSGNSVAEETGPGQDGTSINFDGSNDRAHGSNDDTPFDDLAAATMCGWFNSDTNQTDTAIMLWEEVAGYTLWDLQLDTSSGQVYSTIDLTSGSYTATSTNQGTGYWNGAWHHICAVFDQSLSTGRLKVYIDTNEVASSNAANFPIDYNDFGGTGEFHIGRSPFSANYFDGRIDDVRFYDRALSTTDITALYTATGGSSGSYETITLDSAAGYAEHSGGSSSSKTFSHTVGSGTNRILILAFASHDNTGYGDITSASYNGAALTSALKTTRTSGGIQMDTEIWYLLNPDVGTHNVVVNYNAAGYSMGAMTYSYFGVAQEAPTVTDFLTTGNTTGGVRTLTLNTTVDNSLMIDAFAVGYSCVANPGTGQTLHHQLPSTCPTSSFDHTTMSSSKIATTAGANNMTVDDNDGASGIDGNAYSAVAFAPAAASSSVTLLGSWVINDSTSILSTHTVPSGTNRLLVLIGSGVGFGDGAETMTATFGGQTMTEITHVASSGGYDVPMEMWYLNEAGIAAASGTAFGLKTSWKNNLYAKGYFIGFYENVDQTTPIGAWASNSGNGTGVANPISTTALATNNGDMVVVAASSNKHPMGTFTAQNGFTKQQQDGYDGGDDDSFGHVVADKAATGANETPSMSQTAPPYGFSIIGAVVQAAAGGGGSSCSNEGEMEYTAATKLEYCDGTNWLTIAQ